MALASRLSRRADLRWQPPISRRHCQWTCSKAFEGDQEELDIILCRIGEFDDASGLLNPPLPFVDARSMN